MRSDFAFRTIRSTLFPALVASATAAGLLFDATLAHGADALTQAQTSFDALTSYRVTMRVADGESPTTTETLRYVYKKPGWVRIEMVNPHAGVELVYDPQVRRVTVWPRGQGHFPTLTFRPDNSLLTGKHGQRIDQSDVGEMLKQARRLVDKGSLKVIGNEMVGTRAAEHIAAIGPTAAVTPDQDNASAPPAGASSLRRLDIWLSLDRHFPLKIESRDNLNRRIEQIVMDDAEVDPTLPDTLFDTRDAKPATAATADTSVASAASAASPSLPANSR